ncbi:hypothetical protein [Pararhizobium arenae]|uniref:hypothetical protein n=1 Tax=Pararhizobium arenae TaxID=1856850 RepID=UPI00094B1F7E|nr:hypothetical protein [Pararhizobium arenae]
MHLIKAASFTFDVARSSLDVTAMHLRDACRRAGVTLDGTMSAPVGTHDTVQTLTAKEPDMTEINETLSASHEDNQVETAAPKKKRYSGLRGPMVAAKIRDARDKFLAEQGKMPTFSWLQRETGCAFDTIKKYLSEEPVAETTKDAAGSPADDAASKQVMPSGVRSELQFSVTPEVVQVVSELVHGTELVQGVYMIAGDEMRCDGAREVPGGFIPLVQKWRRHQTDVTKILETARALASA